MAGLLDFIKTPEGQGLLGMVAGYAANAQKGAPINSVGRGLGAGLLAYNGAQQFQDKSSQEAQERELRSMQIAQMRRQVADQTLADETAKRFFTPAVPGTMGDASLPSDLQTGSVPMAAKPASFDMKGYAQARMGQNPAEGMRLLAALQKETPINKFDVKDFTPASVQKFAQTGNYADLVRMDKAHFADMGGSVGAFDPFTGRPLGAGAGAPKTGNPYSDLLVQGHDGSLMPNAPLINAKSQIAKAGASNINVNTEKNLLNNIGDGLGKAMTEARGSAQAALGTIGTVNRLMDALDSGKVMAGPGTSFRQYGLQVGNMLGVSGKDSQEKLLNTRQAIQSLAQLELDAAQQMKGQGQITEAERSIIRRAASGDIDSMTTSELRLLGGVLDRSARSKISGYRSQIEPLKGNPNAAPLVPFLDVQEPTSRQAPNVIRFDSSGNIIQH